MADRYIRTLFSDFSKGLDLVDHNVLNLSAKKGYDITRATLAKKKVMANKLVRVKLPP